MKAIGLILLAYCATALAAPSLYAASPAHAQLFRSLSNVAASHNQTIDGLERTNCTLCELLVDLLVAGLNANETVDLLEDIATLFCIATKIYGGYPDVCTGMIKEDGAEVVYVYSHHYLQPEVVCSKLGFCTNGGGVTPAPVVRPKPEWDAQKVLTNHGGITGSAPYPPPPLNPLTDPEIGTIVHISDVHLDLYYTVLSRAFVAGSFLVCVCAFLLTC